VCVLFLIGYPQLPVLPLAEWYKLTYLVLTCRKTPINQHQRAEPVSPFPDSPTQKDLLTKSANTTKSVLNPEATKFELHDLCFQSQAISGTSGNTVRRNRNL